MVLMLAVGIPVFLIFGGALLAFAFSARPEADDTSTVKVAPTSQPRPLVFFQPTGWSADGRQTTVEELVASIESHLREERRAASALFQHPAPPTND